MDIALYVGSEGDFRCCEKAGKAEVTIYPGDGVFTAEIESEKNPDYGDSEMFNLNSSQFVGLGVLSPESESVPKPKNLITRTPPTGMEWGRRIILVFGDESTYTFNIQTGFIQLNVTNGKSNPEISIRIGPAKAIFPEDIERQEIKMIYVCSSWPFRPDGEYFV